MNAAGNKVRITRILKSWAVSCDECADAGSLIHFMRPWAVAADHATALTLARWHVGEHAARNCRHCERPYALPAITPIDKTHVNFDGLLLFESSFDIPQPTCQHKGQTVYGVYGQHGDKQGAVSRPNGTSRGTKARDTRHAGEVMGIDWMTEWSDIADSIPPAYTEHIGRALLDSLDIEVAA